MALCKTFLFYPFSVLLALYYSVRMKTTVRERKPEALVEAIFTQFYGLLEPLQVRGEILELLALTETLRPSAILEIGTATGGTLFLFSHILSEDGTIASIDLPHGPFGGGYPFWKIPLYRSFASPDQKMLLLREDSHGKAAQQRVKGFLGARQLDLLFIDGDHSYQGVKDDYESYLPLVRRGGIIAFHDIVANPSQPGCEVWKFWNEIKTGRQHREIIEDLNQGKAGIGVLFG